MWHYLHNPDHVGSAALCRALIFESRAIILNGMEVAINAAMSVGDDPKQYAAFVEGIGNLQATWKRLTADQDLEKSVGILEELAAEPIEGSVRKQARDLQVARSANVLKSGSAGAISLVSRMSIRPNTFHGEE